MKYLKQKFNKSRVPVEKIDQSNHATLVPTNQLIHLSLHFVTYLGASRVVFYKFLGYCGKRLIRLINQSILGLG